MSSDIILQVLRHAALLLVFVASAAGGATIALARSGSSTSTQITKAQAQAFAQAVNLRASDLPGATALKGAILKGRRPEARYINVDAAFFRVGPADIAFFALGATRFPPATEIQLLTLLHSRAEAHKLQLLPAEK